MGSCEGSSPVAALSEPVAIVGMAMRLPGDVNSGPEFWKMLTEGRHGLIRVPEDRYNVDAFYSKDRKRGTVWSRRGNFLQRSIRHFDSSFFSMTDVEIEELDPQARQLLEVTREALENAGETNWRGQRIGCYVGIFGEDWQEMHVKDPRDLGPYRLGGYSDSLISNRVSYEYDFTGPSITTKTACSSSLISLSLACQAIENNECTAAIVAGTNLILSPTKTLCMFDQGLLAADGICKTFDANADGYGRGEAINALYIKKVSSAIKDNNPIQAVIRSITSNANGKTTGILRPSSESIEECMRAALRGAEITSHCDIGFVECHGTGTPTGDPLETKAIARIFGNNTVYIGSCKPNVGHSEGASGITSVIKATLALQHRTIPPNIHFESPQRSIAVDRLHIPVKELRWPDGHMERVCVNSIGVGGAKASVIIESSSQSGIQPPKANSGYDSNHGNRLLVFSANHPNSLEKMMKNSKQYLQGKPGATNDLAYTLGARREHLSHRSYCVVGDTVVDGTKGTKPTNKQVLTFVFTGQGSSWLGMGREIIQEYPLALSTVEDLDISLQNLSDPPAWSIKERLLTVHGYRATASPMKAELSQTLCTAIQIVLVNIFHLWEIRPDAVLGHSSGEIAAAYAAGSITQEEAIRMAFIRGRLTAKIAGRGNMFAIGLGRNEVNSFLEDGVVVACENSPSSVTLSGDTAALDRVVQRIRHSGSDLFIRDLHVGVAYHSDHMQAIGLEYEATLDKLMTAKAPQIPFHSSVTASLIDDSFVLSPTYWRQNLELPVLFCGAVRDILDRNPRDNVFVEIGPHSALQSPLRQILHSNHSSDYSYIPALVKGEHATQSMLHCVGQLFIHGCPINFSCLIPGNVLADMPPYPWHHEIEYWDESRISRDWRLQEFKHHDLLGSRITEGSGLEPTWRNILRLEDVPWIRDHQISSNILFPAAGFIAMAGEAVRQLTNTEDYSLREINISSAIVVHDSTPTEIITTLRPHPLTTCLDSVWYHFSIASWNGTLWTKHCHGHVRPGPEHQSKIKRPFQDGRDIQPAAWYKALRLIKAFYGPTFQKLRNIRVESGSSLAQATLENKQARNESYYALHPTSIDACLQLLYAASSKGRSRNLRKLYIPTSIESLYVARPHGEILVSCEAQPLPGGLVTGNGVAHSNNIIVFGIQGLKMSVVEDMEDERGPDSHAAARIHWQPDYDLIPTRELLHSPQSLSQRESIRMVENLSLVCTIESGMKLKSLDTSEPHLAKWRDWLLQQARSPCLLHTCFMDDVPRLLSSSSGKRIRQIEHLMTQLLHTPLESAAIAIKRIFDASRDIFLKKKHPLDILLQDDVLSRIYHDMDRWDYGEFFAALRHTKPWLRVLEIGAGTGGTTARILPHLMSATGERMYTHYHYTDISPGFFINAKKRFADYTQVEYLALDIGKDPIEQGFTEHGYDIVIATNVLHATPSLHVTLQNVGRVLDSSGVLMLSELCPRTKFINYIMGTLPGWWLGATDGRTWEPYVGAERWTDEFQAAGLSRPTVQYDDVPPSQLNMVLVSSPQREIKSTYRTIGLLTNHTTEFSKKLKGELARAGYEVDYCTLEDGPSPGRDIVSILDVEDAFFSSLSQAKLDALLGHVQGAGSSNLILWCTKAAQVNCADPISSPCLGFARVLRNELGIEMATFELDDISSSDSGEAVVKVLGKLQTQERTYGYNPDYEWVLDRGQILLGRMHWFSLKDEMHCRWPRDSSSKRLEMGRKGLLGSLQWVKQPVRLLAAEEVEVTVAAAGMNFKDLMIAQGLLDADLELGLGLECAGTIKRVGSEVKDIMVGDRVLAVGIGSFATEFITHADLCARIPPNLSFKDAATMPGVYATVIHSIIHLGRLSQGQTILIHSACGGVGIAAIQVARMIGAVIYATVGTEDKKSYLMEKYHIPQNHIFHSRDSSFVAQLMQATGDRGVDLVLNSLSGELLHASWKCVAPFGCMVELGRRDIVDSGKLNMTGFHTNRAFFAVDLSTIFSERPDKGNKLLEECLRYYSEGTIDPISPVSVFPAGAMEDAFRFMQRGSHIGKIVIEFPESSQQLPGLDRHGELRLKSDASYLLVGGLGGLGRAVSTWMVEHGAKGLIYLTRSANEPIKHESFFCELRQMGCSVQAFSGSVENLEDVQRAVRAAAMPIAGVLHMSLVLQDGPIEKMTIDQWDAVVKPKVDGTWNLHQATESLSLDFMVICSSIAAILGQAGQANYAAANSFLDAFTQFRRAKGLVCSVLDIGPVEDVGYLSDNDALLEQFKSRGYYMLRERDLLDALHAAILISRPSIPETYVCDAQIVLGLRTTDPSRPTSNAHPLHVDRRMSMYRNIAQVNGPSDRTATGSMLQEFLVKARSNPGMLQEPESAEFLARELGKMVHEILPFANDEVDLSQSFNAMGVDSLVGIELRNWCRKKLGLEVTVMDLFAQPSLMAFGEYAASELLEKSQPQ